MMTNRGFLVVVEGVDGAGKSTVLRRLEEVLLEEGASVRSSREPTDGPHGRRLRASAVEGRLSLEEELELFIEDRRQHVEELIAPALLRGEVVLLDRYYLSTAAYQGARGADPDAVLALNESFAPVPDLVLLLDLDPRLSLERIRARGGEADSFERLDALEAVRRIFLAIQRPWIRRIDASGTGDAVASLCVDAMKETLGLRGY